MAIINIYEARTQFSQLVERARQGEEILIAKAGTCVARLGPLEETAQRKPGGWEGLVEIADDFDAPLPSAFWTGES